jgi:4-hydroxybenzoate polyprenyltransferase
MAAATTNFQTLRLVAADIKLAHSVFALPFAILAACMAAPQPLSTDFAVQLLLVVAAMVCARTVAMLANRLIDRKIDQANPRTAGRAIPSGRLAPSRALMVLITCAALFMFVCAAFGLLFENWWPAYLGPLVLMWIGAYPWLKRFTAICHVYLGSSLAISPLAAAMAIDPRSLESQPALWLLGAMVLCWVAGFDIIYALQDVEIDRRQGLHSIPARFGVPAAIWFSRLLHTCALACLVMTWRIDARFGALVGVGIAIVAALLFYEHLTVARWGTTRIAMAFFTLNGAISCVVGVLGVIDVLFL